MRHGHAHVEVVDKKAYVATVTNKSGNLEMEIQVEKGIGYAPIEYQDKNNLEIGNIEPVMEMIEKDDMGKPFKIF